MSRRTPIADPRQATAQSRPGEPLTVERAIRLVEGWHDLPTQRRRSGLVSDLSSVARMVGMPAGAVLLTPAALRETLLSRSAAGYGVSTSRMRNILSSLRFVLRRAGVIDPTGTYVAEPWLVLLDRLDVRKKAEVIGFARFCSLRQAAPGAVTMEMLEAFEEQLTARSLTPRVRKRIGSLRKFWNRSCGQVEGWPATRLERPHHRHDYVLPLAEFSEGFRKDLAAFGHGLTATILDDPFSDEPEPAEGELPEPKAKPHKPVRALTAALRQSHARWAASALVASGVPIAEVTSLADLVTPLQHARAILRFLYRRAGSKPSAAGMHVAHVLRMIAKHHVRSSAKDVAQIQKWAAAVRLKYPGMTEKNEKLIRAASAPVADCKLLELAEALMKAARKLLPKSPRQANSLALQAMAVEILSKTPLRLANLVGLRLDRHLQRADPKRNRITHLLIPRDETKNENMISVPVSEITAALIEEWITKFRPVAASPGCVYLFPGCGTGNKPITPQGLRDAVKGAMRRHVGVELSPQRFRHLAAHHYLEQYPTDYASVQQLLGHKDPGTARRHYIHKEQNSAHERYDEVVLNRKETLRQPRHSKTPRRAASQGQAAPHGPGQRRAVRVGFGDDGRSRPRRGP